MSARSDNGRRDGVPWWGLVSSVCSPVLLVLGWTVAATLQPGGPGDYDWIRQTVSALAAPDAIDPWTMSLTFLVVGACDVVTGLALRPAARPGRIALIAGAIGGMLVAANPEPAGGGSSVRHAFFAGFGLVALMIWPVLAAHWRGAGEEPAPWALRPAIAVRASLVTAVLFAWFGVELIAGLSQLGLAERALGEFQALWPLVVVLSCRLRPGRPGRRGRPAPSERGEADETRRPGYARSRASRTWTSADS